ncbi:MAG: hypothetical protein U0Q18_34630 [Bryobacteraceae bacterium]
MVGTRKNHPTLSVAAFLLFAQPSPAAAASPAIGVSGGLQTGNTVQALVFTWNSALPVEGSGWAPAETVSVTLLGPLNSLGVGQTTISLGSVTAGSQGAFSTTVTIPYDQGVVGAQASIPRPGLYDVRATGSSSGSVTAAHQINLAPATYLGAGTTIDWSHERGTRDGVLPGPLRAYSPERSDPNWISVWDNRPVGIYGTITATDAGGANQPARVSFEDDPITHYAHDTNFYLLPDLPYLWTVGTANDFSNGEDESGVALGRIEVEWEALNNVTAATYETGQIGLPAWAMASSGDRVYVVGRWVLDCGHPELGDRTEMHPPRLSAVMRQRPAVSSAGTSAAQVDLYVSGHGGAANHYPAGMDALLNQGGRGGGRLRDVLSASDLQTYYQPGPLPLLESPLIVLLSQQLTGNSPSGPIYPAAGPSAFIWGSPAPEEQPVNDMDYDFDVPLPPPPAGAVSVNVDVTTRPQHTTSVAEVITYPNSGGALPATAHVHLPYNGADNGIYARTLKFSWNTASAPAQNHFRVHLDSLTVNSVPGEWHVWSDVSGQWSYLTGAVPALLSTSQGQSITLPGTQYDVYTGPSDTLEVLVQGYRATCIDHLFGTLFGMASYSAGIQLLEQCGPVNNDDLGGALLRLPALPSSQGSYTVQADASDQTGGGAFQLKLTVEYVSAEPLPPDCQGRSSLTPTIGSGGVVGAGLNTPLVPQISPDGLLTVFGQNFAPPGTSRTVAAADLQNGALPVNLACTCVAVNDHLAPLLYVSPGQINFQAPALPVESVAVQVIANCSAPSQAASGSQTVPVQPASPEFFFLTRSTTGPSPVAAINALTGALVGPSGILPSVTVTPAKPGDYVSLYLTGLGATNPVILPGVLGRQAAPSVLPVSVSLNGVQLSAGGVLYAGTAPGFAGLYQVNIQIPANAPAGNLPISVTANGATTPSGAFLAVQP